MTSFASQQTFFVMMCSWRPLVSEAQADTMLHYVTDNTRPLLARVALWCAGAALSLTRRRPGPFLVGSVAFAALALGAHPLFEHNLPQNTSSPLYGIAGNFRMAWHPLRGTMASEVERARAA